MDLKSLLTPPKTIAVVGLSDKPQRPSYEVATYLQNHGFTIIPVNPMITAWRGIPTYPSITAIPRNVIIGIVDIFRKSEEVLPIVREVVQSGRTPFIWMQEGVISPEAELFARTHGMSVMMDHCIMKTHQKL